MLHRWYRPLKGQESHRHEGAVFCLVSSGDHDHGGPVQGQPPLAAYHP